MERQVMELLKNAELSKSEIARALGKEKPTRYLNDLMKKLMENGQLAYTIPEKPNSRLQKYRITDQGKVRIQERGEGNE
jgi:ATP-dependent DNA helicase RecG